MTILWLMRRCIVWFRISMILCCIFHFNYDNNPLSLLLIGRKIELKIWSFNIHFSKWRPLCSSQNKIQHGLWSLGTRLIWFRTKSCKFIESLTFCDEVELHLNLSWLFWNFSFELYFYFDSWYAYEYLRYYFKSNISDLTLTQMIFSCYTTLLLENLHFLPQI